MVNKTTGPLVRLLSALILALSLLGATAFSVSAAPGTASNPQPASFQDDAIDDDDATDDDATDDDAVDDDDDGPNDDDDATDDDATDDDGTPVTSVQSFAQAAGPQPVEDDGGRIVYELDAGTYLVTMIAAPDGCDTADPFTTEVNAGETTTETVVLSCASFAGDDGGNGDGASDDDDDDGGTGTGGSSTSGGSSAVSSLPSTGQGSESGVTGSAIVLLLSAMSLVAITAAFAWRQRRPI